MFIFILLLFLLVCGGLAVLTIFNFATQVHIVFLSWQSPTLPLGMWMMMTFFLGALLLYLVSIASAWDDRREIKKLRKQNLELQQQIITAPSPAFVAPDNAQHTPMPMPNMTPSQAGVSVGNLMPENAR